VHIHQGRNGLTISRRSFLRSGTLSAVAAQTLTSFGLDATRNKQIAERESKQGFSYKPDFLESAKGAAQWIESARKQDERGVYWLPEPDHPEKTTTISAPNAIYSGSAGTVLFFMELANATGEKRYLEIAALGADYLVATWKDLADKPSEGLLSAEGLNLSFYGGLAGVAFVLNEAGKATGDAKYREAARAATDYIVQAAKSAGSGFAWSGAPGIAGDGSIVLFLLYAAREFDSDLYRVTAQHAGDHILERATNERRGGFSWRGFPRFPGLPEDAYFPNFEGGTAGVAYVFARLYAETNKSRYLFAAQQGALHLQTIATLHGDAALIPYRLPDLPDLFYLGFCHGPAGTARTFFELHKITRDPIYQVWTERLAQGVVQSGIPESLTPGYWNVVCQCCGSAAIIDFFIGLWASTGRSDYLAFAQRVARQLVSRETNLDGKGNRWYQAWTRVKPWEVNAETGYSIGASGVGAALLHIHLAEQGKYSAILLPDNPFANARKA
jgi:lantibiotic modifying enzyme